ncbi:hypothetical protein AFM11_30105 [Mycolicibacterium wolinskyi]|uniref:Uncharacterized protein n=1 Tax=Mycolicibacterium wolinskyi TaxID=59750 RepID=A0A132PDN7_9MYCO|nr:hypothetical protein AFM11_30105 [Mycolicibacterium wolinskyi]
MCGGFGLRAGWWPSAAILRIALVTSLAASWRSMWPALGRCRWVAPGMALAIWWECAGGVSRSAPPLITVVVARMLGRIDRWS